MQTYKWPEIRKHDSFESMWIVIHGKVYDVTPFIDDHPGGISVLLGAAGGDATAAFIAAKHPASITERLAKLQIGTLAGA
uniref:Cytochrome b5 heme-binding domain-containing protein n=1 Tax=Panagrellus redivivus TaxID=6233 RepID=A0A7E4V000_PANRE